MKFYTIIKHKVTSLVIIVNILTIITKTIINVKSIIVSSLSGYEQSAVYIIPKAHKHVNLIVNTSLSQWLDKKALNLPNIYYSKLMRSKPYKTYDETKTNDNYKAIPSNTHASEIIHNNLVGSIKHYPPANKEWLNSIYVYNNSAAKVLPLSDWDISKLLKSYFNSYSRKLEGKIKKSRSRKSRTIGARLTTNRVLISRSEIKHTNEKAFITVYVYNNEKKLYLGKLRRLDTNITEDLAYIIIKNISLNIKCKMYEHKFSLHKLLYNKKPVVYNKIANINEMKYTQDFVRKYLRKQIASAYIKQLIKFNKLKFEKQYVMPLTKQAENIYNKKVMFKFVNLKYIHLSSYVLSAAIITKIKKRSNKILEVLNKSLALFNVPELDRIAVYKDIYNKEMLTQNLRVNNAIAKFSKRDISNHADSPERSFSYAVSELLGLKPIWECFAIRYLCMNYCYYYLNKWGMVDTNYSNFIRQDKIMDVKCKQYLSYKLVKHLRDELNILKVCCVYECSAYMEIFYSICRYVVNSEKYIRNDDYKSSFIRSIYKNFNLSEANYSYINVRSHNYGKMESTITNTTITDNKNPILLREKLKFILPRLKKYFFRLVWLNKLGEVMRVNKNRSVSGLRLELAGRLTPRNTADRSISKLAYKGNIRNMDSSDKGLSTVMLRGNSKSNLQYNRAKSKRRIGSFGLKGWISSS